MIAFGRADALNAVFNLQLLQVSLYRTWGYTQQRGESRNGGVGVLMHCIDDFPRRFPRTSPTQALRQPERQHHTITLHRHGGWLQASLLHQRDDLQSASAPSLNETPAVENFGQGAAGAVFVGGGLIEYQH